MTYLDVLYLYIIGHRMCTCVVLLEVYTTYLRMSRKWYYKSQHSMPTCQMRHVYMCRTLRSLHNMSKVINYLWSTTQFTDTSNTTCDMSINMTKYVSIIFLIWTSELHLHCIKKMLCTSKNCCKCRKIKKKNTNNYFNLLRFHPYTIQNSQNNVSRFNRFVIINSICSF